MFTNDSFFEQDVHETDVSFEGILYDAYQRSGETEGTKRPEQDEPIEELTKRVSICEHKKADRIFCPVGCDVIIKF